MLLMKKINIKQIATTIDVSDNLAGKYLRGVARPSFENIYKLNKKLKIPFSVWLDESNQFNYFNNTQSKGATTSLQKDVS